MESSDGGWGRNVAVVVGTESSCRRRAWTLDVVVASPWSSALEAVVGKVSLAGPVQRALVSYVITT